jgi:hypothetical membrane protein
MDHTRLSGLLLTVGGAQFLVGILLAEALYPGYSVSWNYISDLGVPGMPSAPAFTATVLLLGLLGGIAALLLLHQRLGTLLPAALLVSSIGCIGVGISPETTGLSHVLFAFISFVAGAVAVISSSRVTTSPLSIVALILGLVSLFALILLMVRGPDASFPGFVERLIVYPLIIWQIAFGGYLLR